jgi:hypothetical protein
MHLSISRNMRTPTSSSAVRIKLPSIDIIRYAEAVGGTIVEEEEDSGDEPRVKA